MSNIHWQDERGWKDGGRDAFYGWRKAHPEAVSFQFGRCKSGQLWFWSVVDFNNDFSHTDGWEDTEERALFAARTTIERLAAGRFATAVLSQHTAYRRLKEINKERRAAKPPPDTSGSKPVEYLYGYYTNEKFQIVKKTAKRIYYLPSQSDDDDTIYFVNRQKIERDGAVWARGARDRLSLKPSEQKPDRNGRAPDLRQLKAEMAAAHPDKGGNNADFIRARERYLAAKNGGAP